MISRRPRKTPAGFNIQFPPSPGSDAAEGTDGESTGRKAMTSLPNSPSESTDQAIQPVPRPEKEYPRRIKLPFDLRQTQGIVLDRDVARALGAIFPGTHSVAFQHGVLCLGVGSFPERPWPVTVAGVPLYLSLEPYPCYSPTRGALRALRQPSIFPDIQGEQMDDWTPLFEAVRSYLDDRQVRVSEIIYRKICLNIVLIDRATDTNKLPNRAGNLPCLYLFEDQMDRSSFPLVRHRNIEPMPGSTVSDHSTYDVLQPGMLISSNRFPVSSPEGPDQFMSTTTGVLVQSATGEKFMTVAANGFPPVCGPTVAHPMPDKTENREIGRLVDQVGHTDIGLVRLSRDEIFINTTFQNVDAPDGTVLRRLANMASVKVYDEVRMDTPDTGPLIGSISGLGRRLFYDKEQEWLTTTWVYLGQTDSSHLPGSMCGSAIWNDKGEVLGFFQYAPTESSPMRDCCGISVEELIDHGFTLVDPLR